MHKAQSIVAIDNTIVAAVFFYFKDTRVGRALVNGDDHLKSLTALSGWKI